MNPPAPERSAVAPLPTWYQRALDVPSEACDVIVDGCTIHYVTWGEVGKPGIVLLHGSNAHLEWWRMVAPFLADHFRVAPWISPVPVTAAGAMPIPVPSLPGK